MPGAPLEPPQQASKARLAFRPSRLRWPEWVVGVSAAVLTVSLFGMTWFTVSPAQPAAGSASASYSVNGWDGLSHGRWLILITIVAAFALFVLQAVRPTPTLPVTMSVVVMILGVLTSIWLVFRVIIDPPAGREAGGWVGLASALALALGGWRSTATEGIAAEDGPGAIPIVSQAELAASQAQTAAEESAPADRS